MAIAYMDKSKQNVPWDTKNSQFVLEHLTIIKSLVEAKNDLLLRELCDRALALLNDGDEFQKAEVRRQRALMNPRLKTWDARL
ncbi:hypothetical protein NIES4075_19580 [Tolypothrix sp. NIES-4075]|nr:hypothetical protein NIES4075_19580 [Tolypothrix sp. NIES-4075]